MWWGKGRGRSRSRDRAGGAKIGAGTGLAAIVMLRTKVEVVIHQTLAVGTQLVLSSYTVHTHSYVYAAD